MQGRGGTLTFLKSSTGCSSPMIGGATAPAGLSGFGGDGGLCPPASVAVANDHGVLRNEIDGQPTKTYFLGGHLGGSAG